MWMSLSAAGRGGRPHALFHGAGMTGSFLFKFENKIKHKYIRFISASKKAAEVLSTEYSPPKS